jgi:Peptidase U49
MNAFEELVAGSAFAAAPEKAEQLYARVRNIKLEFLHEPRPKAGSFKFSANPETRVIKISEGALELLWAASFAFTTLFQVCRDSQRAGQDRVNAVDFPELQKAFRLYGWALNKCHREACEAWPGEFPSSQNVDLQTRLATELFLVAVGWILLHESAHILLDHKIDGPSDLKKREERDADRFASEWLLDRVTDRKLLQKRSLGIAIATLTLTALDLRAKRLDLKDHPRAVERLSVNLRNYLSDEDAELAHALAITVLQAHFSIFHVDHAIDHHAEFGNLLDSLCVDLTHHNF